MSLQEAMARYSQFQAARGDAACHRTECARMLGTFAYQAGKVDLTEITPDELRAFLILIRSRPGQQGRPHVSDATVFAYHRTLAAFFHYAVTAGYLTTNPMAQVPKPKVVQPLIRPFSTDQVQKLLQQPDVTTFVGLRDTTLMTFLLDTGCRVSEALALTFADLNLSGLTARVMGKGKRERDVPFGERTREWLQCYLDRRKENGCSEYVFVNQDGERLSRNSISRRIARYGRAAGLRGVRPSPHTFRHTFAVSWLLGGDGEYKGDALSLQRILGHTTPTMTQRYVNLTSQDLQRMHRKLSPADRVAERPPQGQKKRLR